MRQEDENDALRDADKSNEIQLRAEYVETLLRVLVAYDD